VEDRQNASDVGERSQKEGEPTMKLFFIAIAIDEVICSRLPDSEAGNDFTQRRLIKRSG
jgi:hypothetical protein